MTKLVGKASKTVRTISTAMLRSVVGGGPIGHERGQPFHQAPLTIQASPLTIVRRA